MEESTLALKYSSRQRKPSSSTTDIGWASKTMYSQTFCVIANAFKLSVRNLSHCWSASVKVSCWAVLSSAPLVLLSCRNPKCYLAWCFWMCLIKLVILYFAVLTPSLEKIPLQTLQTAFELIDVSSVKYLHTADSSNFNFSSTRHVLLKNDVGRVATEEKKQNWTGPWIWSVLLSFPIPDSAILSISGPISNLTIGLVHP